MENVVLDTNTEQHSERVEQLMRAFIKDHPNMYKYEDELIIASRIHDIGKSMIPEEILNAPRRLTPQEREIIDWHSYYSYELAKKQGYSDIVCQIVLLHHGVDKPKKVDIEISDEVKEHAKLLQVMDTYDILTNKRTYYEEAELGVKITDEILKSAAMLRVLDAYDALTSKRTYKDEMTDAKAIDILSHSSEFDEKCIEMLKEWNERKELLVEFKKEAIRNENSKQVDRVQLDPKPVERPIPPITPTSQLDPRPERITPPPIIPTSELEPKPTEHVPINEQVNRADILKENKATNLTDNISNNHDHGMAM